MKKLKSFEGNFGSCLLVTILFFFTGFELAIGQQEINSDEINPQEIKIESESVAGANPLKEKVPTVKLGQYEFKFGRDISATGGMSRYRVVFLGKLIEGEASVGGGESNKVTLPSEDANLYSYFFFTHHKKILDFSFTTWLFVRTLFDSTRIYFGFGPETVLVRLHGSKEISVGPYEFTGKTICGDVKFNLRIDVEFETRIYGNLKFDFPRNGVEVTGSLDSTNVAVMHRMVSLIEKPDLMTVHSFYVTGEFWMNPADTVYTVQARPKFEFLSGWASSNIGKMIFKSHGQGAKLTATCPFDPPPLFPGFRPPNLVLEFPVIDFEGASSNVDLYRK